MSSFCDDNILRAVDALSAQIVKRQDEHSDLEDQLA